MRLGGGGSLWLNPAHRSLDPMAVRLDCGLDKRLIQLVKEGNGQLRGLGVTADRFRDSVSYALLGVASDFAVLSFVCLTAVQLRGAWHGTWVEFESHGRGAKSKCGEGTG